MLLDVKELKTYFFTSRGVVPAVSNASFSVEKGHVTALVGESGSGKSVTAMSILRLVSKPGRVVAGEINFEGRDLLKLSKAQMRDVRGREISIIFQEPMTSLNPVLTCGKQVREVLEIHNREMSRKEIDNRVIELFDLVGIPEPRRRIKEYPYQLSGGMRQRVMIALALACSPKLLIADEATTALDVTIQAQILDLLRDLQQKMGMSVLLITHDLGVVAELADDVIVMYGGSIQESGTVEQVLCEPLHPYTVGLLKSIPTLEGAGKYSDEKLNCINGTVPDLLELPEGCVFCPRCDCAMEICKTKKPPVITVGECRTVACWHHDGGDEHGN